MAESDRALLVLDMQADAGGGVPPLAETILRFVQGELRYFRERGRPVFFALTHLPAPLRSPVLDVAGASSSFTPVMLQEFTPRTDEPVIVKSSPSAFFHTPLQEHLDRSRVRRITLVGLETHTSVLLTAADAFARGFDVIVPDPCVAAADPELHKTALRLVRDAWPRFFGRAPNAEEADETGRLRRVPSSSKPDVPPSEL